MNMNSFDLTVEYFCRLKAVGISDLSHMMLNMYRQRNQFVNQQIKSVYHSVQFRELGDVHS